MNFIKYISLLFFSTLMFTSCIDEKDSKKSTTATNGVKKVVAKVVTGDDGLTVEQRNATKRLRKDNDLGAVKHLYVISPYSGQVLIYSTVKGKVTSSGKRLSSDVTFVKGDGGQYTRDYVMPRIGDDGTYGSSIPYIYWEDAKGVYRQHFVTGGQIIHISETPLTVKSVIINMEMNSVGEPDTTTPESP